MSSESPQESAQQENEDQEEQEDLEDKEDQMKKNEQEMFSEKLSKQQNQKEDTIDQNPSFSPMKQSSVFGSTFRNKTMNFQQFIENIEFNGGIQARKELQNTLKARQLDFKEFELLIKKQLYVPAYDYIILHKEHLDYIMNPQLLEDIFKMIGVSHQVFYAIQYLKLIPEDS